MNELVMGRVSHTWKRASSMVLTSHPVQYDWICTSCQKQVTCNKPPLEECPVVFQSRRNERMF